jgi:hypothetical protein
MAVTLGTLKNEILAITARDDASYSSFAQSAVISAIKYMETEHPYVLQKGGAVTVLSGTNTIPLPNDLNQLIYAQYNIGGSIYNAPLGFQEVTYPDLLSLFSTTTESGNPTKCAVFNESLYLYPNTTSDIEFTLYYYYTDSSYPEIDSDTSVWFNDATFDCVRTKAIEWFYRFPLESPALADTYKMTFDDFLRNLRMKNNTKRFSNTLSI